LNRHVTELEDLVRRWQAGWSLAREWNDYTVEDGGWSLAADMVVARSC
jgi:hypothetical protein